MPRVDLTALYRSHGHLVTRRARQILGNAADAHELTQELFMSLCEDPTSLDGVHTPAAWLYTALGLVGFVLVLAGVPMLWCFVGLMIGVVWPVFYSLILYKRLQAQGKL